MIRKNEWEEFFDDHAPIYMENCFTKNTIKEVDFILDELNLLPGCSILDMGCGTGRHAVELAKRRYQVTGVDISSGMLAEAKKTAQEAKVKIEWIHSDATKFISDKLFGDRFAKVAYPDDDTMNMVRARWKEHGTQAEH